MLIHHDVQTIEEPLKEPISEGLDVSNSVVDASYRYQAAISTKLANLSWHVWLAPISAHRCGIM